jgi:hypothetical protein
MPRRNRPAKASLAIGGSGQSDVAESREHVGVACLLFEPSTLLTEMLDMQRHRFHFLQRERIETPFLKRSSQFTNECFHAAFKSMCIGRAHARLQKEVCRIGQPPAQCHQCLGQHSQGRRLFLNRPILSRLTAQ